MEQVLAYIHIAGTLFTCGLVVRTYGKRRKGSQFLLWMTAAVVWPFILAHTLFRDRDSDRIGD